MARRKDWAAEQMVLRPPPTQAPRPTHPHPHTHTSPLPNPKPLLSPACPPAPFSSFRRSYNLLAVPITYSRLKLLLAMRTVDCGMRTAE